MFLIFSIATFSKLALLSNLQPQLPHLTELLAVLYSSLHNSYAPKI